MVATNKGSGTASVPVAIHPVAVDSLKRQQQFLLNVVQGMAKAEESRQERLGRTRNQKDRKNLEARYKNERKAEAVRVVRLKEETKQLKMAAEQGSYNGTVRNVNMAKPKPMSDVEVTGLEARGGLTDGQYKFLKEVYNKFEAPIKPPRGKEWSVGGAKARAKRRHKVLYRLPA